MSPSASAPRMASTSACSATSASEWPVSPRSCGILTPPSQTWSPSPKACTSKPLPRRRSARLAIRRASALAKSSSVVSFTLPLSPANVATFMPAHSASAASSVKSSRPSLAARRCASSSAGKANACGVCTARSSARSTVPATWPPASTRLMVSVTSSAGMAAPVSPQATMARDTSSAEQNGRAASWTSTMSGARALERLEAGPHRGLPRRAARHRRQQPQALGGRRRRSRRSSGWITACTAPIWPCQANSDRLDRITGSPANCRYCLGKSPPARSPRPAATITAATEGPIAISDRIPRSGPRFSAFPWSGKRISTGRHYVAMQHLRCRN